MADAAVSCGVECWECWVAACMGSDADCCLTGIAGAGAVLCTPSPL